jgi:hypothetical protein
MAEADALVIEKVRGVLTPGVADEVIDETLETLAQRKRARADAPDRLNAEARQLRKELDRFLAAIAGGTAPATVLAEIARREARLVEIERACDRRAVGTGGAPATAHAPRSARAVRRAARRRRRRRGRCCGRFRPAERRGERGYQLRWSLVTAALMDGYIGVATPRGFEPRLPP